MCVCVRFVFVGGKNVGYLWGVRFGCVCRSCVCVGEKGREGEKCTDENQI